MKRAALGFRMHSGWGVMVAVDDSEQIIRRQRISLIADDTPGGKQPYHHAEQLGLPAAEPYLLNYVSECNRLARDVLGEIVAQLQTRFLVAGAAILQASGRNLPPLRQILAAHPLIHTAEGKLFRDVIRSACESLNLSVLEVPEREVEKRVRESFTSAAPALIAAIAGASRLLGPPWNADHKSAALAACLALDSGRPAGGKAKASKN